MAARNVAALSSAEVDFKAARAEHSGLREATATAMAALRAAVSFEPAARKSIRAVELALVRSRTAAEETLRAKSTAAHLTACLFSGPTSPREGAIREGLALHEAFRAERSAADATTIARGALTGTLHVLKAGCGSGQIRHGAMILMEAIVEELRCENREWAAMDAFLDPDHLGLTSRLEQPEQPRRTSGTMRRKAG